MRTAHAVALTSSLLGAAPAMAANTDWAKVDQALGKPGTDQPGGIHKYGLPHSDLHVTVDGVVIKPALALGRWLAFQPMGNGSMVMGDIVLTENETNPVMAKLLAEGITVTALHNHLLRAQPAAPMDLDTAKLEQILGHKGSLNGGVYQFGIPRADAVADSGMPVPPAMGTAIGINFQPTGGGKTAITGDFVLLASEVNPVLPALRENGIEVTALHNHMLDDQPRMFFVHFWANNNAVKLAQGLRAALDRVNVARS